MTTTKPWRQNGDSPDPYAFAREIGYPDQRDWPTLRERLTPARRDIVLDLAVRLTKNVPGHIVEFGVADGDSTRVLRRSLRKAHRWQLVGPRKRIFACDSFQGLTEKFENAEIGTFACDPPSIRGVTIVEGFFEESLTPDLASRVGSVALASLDADLYSSTLCALRWLTPLLRTGSVLVFDEYLGENGSERSAHLDWQDESGMRTVRIAEFLRDPSGWGSSPDRRVVFQVAGEDSFQPLKMVDLSDAARQMRHYGRALAQRIRP